MKIYKDTVLQFKQMMFIILEDEQRATEVTKEYFTFLLHLKDAGSNGVHHVIPRKFYDKHYQPSEINLKETKFNKLSVSKTQHIECHFLLWKLTKLPEFLSGLNFIQIKKPGYLWNLIPKEEFELERKKVFVSNMQTSDSQAKRRESLEFRYGKVMSPCHTLEANKKRHDTLVSRDGSVNAHMITPEVRSAKALSHSGDPDWQLHSPEARMKMRKSKGIPVLKLTGDKLPLALYWSGKVASAESGIPNGTLKRIIRDKTFYLGFYWYPVSKEVYEFSSGDVCTWAEYCLEYLIPYKEFANLNSITTYLKAI